MTALLKVELKEHHVTALSLLPRATLLQACWFTVTPAADGQASLQVSWGRARQKGPSPGRTLESHTPGLCSLAQLRDTLHETHGFSSSLHPTLRWVSSLLFPVFCCSAAQSCPALCTSMDCSWPDSSAHGISQVRGLEWAAMSFSPFFPMKPLII